MRAHDVHKPVEQHARYKLRMDELMNTERGPVYESVVQITPLPAGTQRGSYA